jgi:hypothetical protein
MGGELVQDEADKTAAEKCIEGADTPVRPTDKYGLAPTSECLPCAPLCELHYLPCAHVLSALPRTSIKNSTGDSRSVSMAGRRLSKRPQRC